MRIDVEQVCAALDEVQKEFPPSGEEEPLRAAALALTFIKDSGHTHNFEDYLECLGHMTAVSHLPTFEARQEAEEWLRSHVAPRHAATVLIDDTRYCVGYSLQSGTRYLIRTPSREELSSAGGGMSPRLDGIQIVLHGARKHSRSSDAVESIDTALVALHFIWEGGLVHDFEDYLRRSEEDVPLPALLTFGTRDEAEAWLDEHPRPPCFAYVEIAGQRYSVGYSRDSDTRVLVRSPWAEETPVR